VIRVSVNNREIALAPGATVREAVLAFDPGLAKALRNGDIYVADGGGRPIEPGGAVEGGAVFRVVEATSGRAAVTRDLVARMPKAELHVHLDGCLRPETMLELAAAYGVSLPADAPDTLAEYMIVKDARNLEEYLARFGVTLSVMQTVEALERIAFEFVEDVARENVRYVEVRYCPALHMPALSIEQAVEAPLAGLKRGMRDHDVSARLIICGLRTLPPETSVEMARAAVRYQGRGVVAFDLAGAEAGHPASDHAEAFAFAAENGLAVTCHAGEGDGPASIREAMDVCRTRRIGHGVRLEEDPDLERRVLSEGVPLEMCITSNVHTRTVPTADEHPARRYLEMGIPVTLNTDSRLIDGITLSDEYWTAHRHVGFDRNALEQVVKNACEHAFLPSNEKRALLDRVTRELEEMP